MRKMSIVILLLCSNILFAQNSMKNENIDKPVYDTSYVDYELVSRNSFYFCNKLYKIPRGCMDSITYPCCDFRCHTNNRDRAINFGVLNCYGNSAISWYYFDSFQNAIGNFGSSFTQREKQVKKLLKTPLNLLIDGQKVQAFKLEITDYQNATLQEIQFCGVVNGQALTGSINGFQNIKLNSSKNFSPFFQTIFQF